MRQNRKVPIKNNTKFAIIVDGECEFWYFHMLKRNEKSIDVDLKPEIPQRKKLKEQFEKVKELSKIYDKVIWVIDLDVIINESRLTKKGQKSAIQEFKEYNDYLKLNCKNSMIIINNPCLEYWILLHFEQTSKYFDTCDGAVKQLLKHLPSYEKTQKYYTKPGDDIYLKLKPKLKTAISNAKKLGNFSFENPYAGMAQLQNLFEIDELKTILLN